MESSVVIDAPACNVLPTGHRSAADNNFASCAAFKAPSRWITRVKVSAPVVSFLSWDTATWTRVSGHPWRRAYICNVITVHAPSAELRRS